MFNLQGVLSIESCLNCFYLSCSFLCQQHWEYLPWNSFVEACAMCAAEGWTTWTLLQWKQPFADVLQFEIGVFKNFAILTVKHLCWSLFNKVAVLKTCNFIKKRLQHRCFPVKIARFLRTPFLHNTSDGCFCYKKPC